MANVGKTLAITVRNFQIRNHAIWLLKSQSSKCLAPIVTLQQFAELEGVSERTAYRWTTGDNPCVPIEPRTIRKGCKKAGGPIRIYYARWKEEQLRKALGHSRFQLVIGA